MRNWAGTYRGGCPDVRPALTYRRRVEPPVPTVDESSQSRHSLRDVPCRFHFSSPAGYCPHLTVASVPPITVTWAGDFWILGRHRLLCGDSTSVGDVAALLAGRPIASDGHGPPPYVLRYDLGLSQRPNLNLNVVKRPSGQALTSIQVMPQASKPKNRTSRSQPISLRIASIIP